MATSRWPPRCAARRAWPRYRLARSNARSRPPGGHGEPSPPGSCGMPTLRTPGSADAELVERGEQLGGVSVDAEGAGRGQLVLAVTARQQADAQHPGATRREQVPDGVADHVAIRDLDAK